MEQLDPQVVCLLKKMANEHYVLADMVRAILSRTSSTGGNPIEVLRYFREAFGLTLAQVKPIADWLAYERNESSDSELHTLVWPCIEWQLDSSRREEVG